MKLHPVIGAEMIQGIPYLAPATPAVRHHHERWNGTGYPDGLEGEDIPLAARIITVADALDAMTTERPYRPPLTQEQAYEEILRCEGSFYDPRVVEAFCDCWTSGIIQDIK
jgi:HD-GYP domain-containing protein (c-di-GMP phosphodiesterase class II)